MVTVMRADRRSAVLTPSSLACLSHMPTINLTSGCAHGCLYCYTRGYTTHPGEDKVVLYGNTLEKLKDELAHKRTKPQAVYFSPSSDLFQPVPEVLALGYRILEFLFSQGIGVAFLSKGHIPDKTMRLLLNHADEVRAQIGIITLDEDVQRMFEPNAASPCVRLEQIVTLVAGGIATEARLDPILPGLTDTPDALRHLFSALAKVGVKRAAASVLFLRPSVLESLKRNVHNKEVLQELLGFYRDARRLAIHAERSSVTALPRATRDEIYARVRQVAEEHAIDLFICACKNPDLAHGTCNIGGTWLRRSSRDAQRSLFDKGG
ncbi:MAG: radical SAM protein [Dehalococcoidia bacterium]